MGDYNAEPESKVGKNASATDSISLLTKVASKIYGSDWTLMDLERFRLKNERLLIIFFVSRDINVQKHCFCGDCEFFCRIISGVYQNFFIKFHKGFVNE
jgi:hypothetical protein